MTTTRAAKGGVIHFPAAIILDSVNVIEPPPASELACIAAAVHPSELLLFSKRLVDAARKRRRNPRWVKVNRQRLELAQLCLNRALGAMPPVSDLDPEELDDAAKRDLVGEAFHTFSEAYARDLAVELDIAFEDCGEAIERLERRPS